MEPVRKTWRATFIAALLGAVTLAAFWPVLHNDFIRYDDRDYVTANPHVLSGLTWDGVKWAFSSGYGGNWHPVTWLSHMTDVQLFGVRPAGHHLSSLLLHVTNTLLLFVLLRKLTDSDWRSAFAAGFFALHPLHVESVAWTAERKDVLSVAFFLLTLWTYAKYVGKAKGSNPESTVHRPQSTDHSPQTTVQQRKSQVPSVTLQVQGPQSKVQSQVGDGRDGLALDARRSTLDYWLVVGFFALGLMSKPMLVTVPFVLLLLDFWPLKRIGWPGGPFGSNWVSLLREKAPFFVLALISSVVTYVVQGRGHAVTVTLPLAVRAGNAVVSYWKYLGKTVWPADLAIFYPHPATRYPASELGPGWLLLGAAAALVAVTFFAVIQRKRAPWSTVGWLWFLGMLVPVIGLVQVGQQAMADRYTYLPLVGVFVCVVWGAAEFSSSRRWATQLLVAAGILALAACACLTQKQAKYWRNNLTVFEHALAVNPNNAVAHCHVGIELGERKNYVAAMEQFNAALKSDPNCAEAYYGLGVTLEHVGNPADAIEQYRNALRAKPWYEPAHSRLGTALWSLGKREQALAEYEAALRQNPDDLEVQYRLGMALLDLGETAQAVPHLGYVARLNPDFGDVVDRLTGALVEQGRLPEAEGRLREVVARFPAKASARINLGNVLWQLGKADEAREQYQAAVRLDPADPVAHYHLGTALSARDRLAEATSEFAEAIRLKPDYLAARVSLGEVLAGQNQMEPALEQFREAVRLSPTNANLVLNLASALVMAGHTNEAATRFAQAVRLQPDLPEKLAQTARTLAKQGLAQAAIARLITALYLKRDAQLYFELATLRLQQANPKEAVICYEQALKLKPNWTEAMNNLAWILATDPRAEVRNGEEAVRLAERACELDGGKEPRLIATLAAAYAEAGRFAEAIATAEKARALATAAGQNELAAEIGAQVEAYRKQVPWRK